MTELQVAIKIAKMKFDWCMSKPESEQWLFNESDSTLPIMEWVYGKLVSHNLILPLEKLSEQEKKDLKAEAKRIDPFAEVSKGMRICKCIASFYYISNNV